MPYREYTDMPYAYDLALGNIPNASVVSIQGRNVAIGSTYEDIWTKGGEIHWPTTPGTCSMVSDSVSDTSTGTGLFKVVITGRDGNGSVQQEEVELNGTNPVVTSSLWSMVLNIDAAEMGSANTNGLSNGVITATVDGGVCCEMPVDSGASSMAATNIPEGHIGLLVGYQISTPNLDNSVIEPVTRASRTSPWRIGQSIEVNEMIFAGVPPIPIGIIPGGSDIRWRAKKVTATDVSISIYFQLIILKL